MHAPATRTAMSPPILPARRTPLRRGTSSSRGHGLPTLLLALVAAAVALVLSPIAVTVASAAEVSSTPLYQQIYKELLTFPCVRLLNNTHSIGCSSPDPSGTTGVLYPASTQQQLDDGYILVIPFDLLSKPTIDRARASGKVNGMLVIEPSSSTQQQSSLRSHETSFPTDPPRHFTGFPMFAIKNTSVTLSQSLGDIVSLAESNRQDRPSTPKYAAELSAFMSAAHSASDCLRRGFCKPLGGQSVYAPLFNPTPETANKPVVLLTAALDGKAMFQDLAQSASTRLASVAALLTAVSTLAQISEADRNNWQRRVLVTFFNGESWGHVGSRTFATDLDTFECRKPYKEGEYQPTAACPYIKPACAEPCMLDTGFKQMGVTTKSISHVLDMNMLGGTADQLRVHTTGSSSGSDATARPFPASIQLSTQPGIPPSPALAFLERNANIQPFILSTLDSGIFPSTYATELDDRAALVARPDALAAVCSAADALVRATLTLATNANTTIPPAVNCTLATSLLDCLTNATACPLGLSVQSNVPRTSYSSVSFFGVGPSWPALVAATLLSNASAAARGPACKANSECSARTPTCLGGTCVQSRARYHLGWPAGIGVDVATGKWVVKDATKPHWVESNWDLTAVRVFARVPRAWMWVEVASGIGVTAATAGAVWWVRSKVSGME
ncbi:Nicastrin-domain-containing protein [Catenaria anguillulae PL171]|uniref:Nicastrin n=1 Tax=Catenaria anguillulae PL171 TaxID=765915 RepID=A0A1Y2I3J2_9FUNG|nr:Nicastrin-domain-containing protein [Catenaria anguillulae PL171]